MKKTHTNFIQFISKLWFIFYNIYLNEKGDKMQIFHVDAMKVLANSCQHEAIVTNKYLTQANFQTKRGTSGKESPTDLWRTSSFWSEVPHLYSISELHTPWAKTCLRSVSP